MLATRDMRLLASAAQSKISRLQRATRSSFLHALGSKQRLEVRNETAVGACFWFSLLLVLLSQILNRLILTRLEHSPPAEHQLSKAAQAPSGGSGRSKSGEVRWLSANRACAVATPAFSFDSRGPLLPGTPEGDG